MTDYEPPKKTPEIAPIFYFRGSRSGGKNKSRRGALHGYVHRAVPIPLGEIGATRSAGVRESPVPWA